jgi:hypothetical protein
MVAPFICPARYGVRGREWIEQGLRRRTVFELATVCGSNCPAPSWSRTVDRRNVEPRDGARLFYFGFVLHHAGVMHFALTSALRNFLSQIWQPRIGAVTLNQNLLSILTRASAFRARQTNNLSGIFAKLNRSAHTLSPRGDDKTFVYCYAALSASKRARAFFPSLAAFAMLSKKTDERSIGAEQQAR